MMEEGVDGRLNFLDVTIISNNGFIQFDWFHKPTFSGRYLHFESRHPLCHKRGITIGLTDKVFRLSHPAFHQGNFELIIKILMDNGYPIPFIFHTVNERLKTFFSSFDGVRVGGGTLVGCDKSNTMTANTDDNISTNKITYYLMYHT